MNSQPERLNERLDNELERMRRRAHNTQQDAHPSVDDLEVKALAMLAHFLQGTPSLQVNPAFADRLERRILAHRAWLQHWHCAHRCWREHLPRPFLTLLTWQVR